MPHFARASFDSLRGLTATAPSSIATETSSGTRKDSSPFWPLIFTVWPETVAVTPDGTATGFLPIRDIPGLPWLGSRGPCRSEDLAEHFPAHVPLSCLVIGHHALRRRDDSAAAHLRVADTGEHVAHGIVDRHCRRSPTSSTSRGPGSALSSRAPGARYATCRACGNTRAAGRSSRSDCGRGSGCRCAGSPPA